MSYVASMTRQLPCRVAIANWWLRATSRSSAAPLVVQHGHRLTHDRAIELRLVLTIVLPGVLCQPGHIAETEHENWQKCVPHGTSPTTVIPVFLDAFAISSDLPDWRDRRLLHYRACLVPRGRRACSGAPARIRLRCGVDDDGAGTPAASSRAAGGPPYQGGQIVEAGGIDAIVLRDKVEPSRSSCARLSRMSRRQPRSGIPIASWSTCDKCEGLIAAMTARIVNINSLRGLAPLPRAPVPRPSPPAPTRPPAGAAGTAHIRLRTGRPRLPGCERDARRAHCRRQAANEPPPLARMSETVPPPETADEGETG